MHTIIIAEAGVNHNGSIEIAKKLIDVASEAGVDYIKFQTFKTDNLVTKYAEQAIYQQENIGKRDKSQYDMLKKLELSEEDHKELIKYCLNKGIKFFSTAFDLESIKYLGTLNPEIWKIPSGEITNYPYLREIASYKQPVILSTGMCEMEDIKNAIEVLVEFGVSKDLITILHCNTDYPTPMRDVNLLAMNTIKETFHTKVGYSDHTEGITVPIAAVALGASIIEKHFTLDKNMIGPDHKASIEPEELKLMVESIRNIETALGNKTKNITESERKNLNIARKSIIAAKSIKKGECFTNENLTTKRPGNGISPMKWENVIGKIATKDFEKDEMIKL